MHLVKWIRKNRAKLMAGFVVVIMIAFVLGGWIQHQSGPGPRRVVAAYYGDDGTITNLDRQTAHNDLRILGQMYGYEYLSMPGDLSGVLLAELLFREHGRSQMVFHSIMQHFHQFGLPVGSAHLNDFYRQRAQSDVIDIWVLLNAEARRAGLNTSPEQVREILARAIPQISGASASEVVRSMMRQGISEKKIYEVFGKLVNVQRYAVMAMPDDQFTLAQTDELLAAANNAIEPNYVHIPARLFVDEEQEIDAGRQQEQFERFRDVHAGSYSDENPYGFGYKLPASVQLEYMVVDMDEVRASVEEPTTSEKQAFFRENYERFAYEQPDPDNPSQTITVHSNYSQVEDYIGQGLLARRVNNKATQILEEARGIVESALQGEYVEYLSDDDYRRLAGSYEEAAAAVSEKHGVRIYAGKTGLLSVADMRMDRYIPMLFAVDREENQTPLIAIAAAAGGIEGVELGAFDMVTPRMFESFGPLSDTVIGQIKAIVRVVDARDAETADDINTSYSNAGIRLGDEGTGRVFSVSEAVAADIRLLDAMPRAAETAGELASLPLDEWDAAIDALNAEHGTEANPAPLFMNSGNPITPVSEYDIWLVEQITKGQPEARSVMTNRLRDKIRAEALFGLLEEGASLPTPTEYWGGPGYFAVKDLKVVSELAEELTREDVAQIIDMRMTPLMLLEHYNAASIMERMGYRRHQDRELAATLEAISPQTGRIAADAEIYVDPVGGRFSVVDSGIFEAEAEESTYTVPRKSSQGSDIARGGERLPVSVATFRADAAEVRIEARPSYESFQFMQQELGQQMREAFVETLRMDGGAMATRYTLVEGNKVTVFIFYQKNNQDNILTISGSKDELMKHVEAINELTGSYRSLGNRA